MNTKHLILVALIMGTTLSTYSQNLIIANQQKPLQGNDAQTTASQVSLNKESINITLFQGATTNEYIQLTNNSTNDFTVGLSLNNTSYETETNPPYLEVPIAYKVFEDKIVAINAYTGENIRERNDYTTYEPDNSFGEDGLAYDGRVLYYINNSKSGIIYKEGIRYPSPTLFIPSFVGKNIAGLAHSGDFLYASNIDDEIIYQIDDESGEIVDSIAVDYLSNGLTFGGNRGTLFASTYHNQTLVILEINIVTKEVIRSFEPVEDDYSSGFTEGIGYSREIDQIVMDDHFYDTRVIDPETGEFIRRVGNEFGTSVAANESLGLAWLDMESVTFDLNAGASHSYKLLFDSRNLESGHYKTTIQFALNDEEDNSVSIPVELNIVPTVEDIIIESFCSLNSNDGYKVRLDNPNHFPLNIRWHFQGTDHQGSTSLKPGYNALILESIPSNVNTLSLEWLDESETLQSKSVTFDGTSCTDGLSLNVVYSEVTNTQIKWKVTNPNPFPVDITWLVNKSYWSADQNTISGSMQATSGESFFYTPVTEQCQPQTTLITWHNESGRAIRHKDIFNGRPCDLRGLTLIAPTCKNNPDDQNVWLVKSPNHFRVSFMWETVGGNEKGTVNGLYNSYFRTNGDTVKITWLGKDGTVRRQKKIAGNTPCDRINTNAARKLSVTEDEVDQAFNEPDIYPNPFNEKIIIALNTYQSEKNYSIRIYNFLGKIVYESFDTSLNEESMVEINTSSFAKGAYLLVFTSEKHTQTAKIIKD